jgi:MFS family permease
VPRIRETLRSTRAPGTPSGRSQLALLTGLAVDNFGSGMFLPLAVVYATRVVGLSVGAAGLTLALATALGFAGPRAAGRLTHRFGPRPVVVVAQLVQGAGAVAYLLAGTVAGVFVAAALLAVGAQLFYCSVFVLVAEISPDEAKERPFAWVGMVRSAAFGAGTLVGAVMVSQHTRAGLQWLVATDALTFVMAALLLRTLVKVSAVDHLAAPAARTLTVLRDRSYLTLMVAVSLMALPLDVALVGTPVYILDVVHGPAWLPGTLLAAGTVLSSVVGIRVVSLLRNRRRTWSLQAAAVAYASFCVGLGIIRFLPAVLLVPVAAGAWLLLVLGNTMANPISGALSEALPPRSERPGYMATFQYAFTCAQVAAPAVVGLFAVAAWLPWTVAAVASLIGLAALQRLSSRIPAHLNRPTAATDPGRRLPV